MGNLDPDETAIHAPQTGRLRWWHHALILLGVSSFIAYALEIPQPPTGHFEEDAFITLGAGLSVAALGLLFAALPAFCARALSGRWPRWSVWTAYPAAGVILYFAYLETAAPSAPREARFEVDEPYTYLSNGCEFMVTFPREPAFRTLYLEDDTEFVEASLRLERGSFIRSECVQYRPQWGSPRKQSGDMWARAVREHLEHEGMRVIEAAVSQGSIAGLSVLIAEGRGTKETSGQRVTYISRAIAGESSVLIQQIGADSSEFPTQAGSAFLDSVEHRGW